MGVSMENIIIDCNNKANVGLDIHNSRLGYYKSLVIKNMKDENFEEDDGSGLGTQTYPPAGIRLKGIYNGGFPSGSVYNVLINCKIEGVGTKTNDVGVYFTSTTPTSSIRPNSNTLINVRCSKLKKGVHIENADAICLQMCDLSDNGIGLEVGNPEGVYAKDNYVVGYLWAENCDVGIKTINAGLIIFGDYATGAIDGNVMVLGLRGENMVEIGRLSDSVNNSINILLFPHTGKTPNYPFWAVFDPSTEEGYFWVGTSWMPWCFREIYRGDYGGNFANFTPPTPKKQGHIFFAEDTNATNPAKRLYISLDGSTWSYVDLT